MSVRIWGATALVAVLLAGCLAGNGPTDPEDPDDPAPAVTPPAPDFDFSTVVQPEHAHSAAALHTAGHGLDLVGFAAIQEILPPTVRGSITQVDVHGDWAVVSGMEGGLAFALVDISDPAAPTAVSWYPSSADGWTARFSGDGAYVFYGCQRLESFNPHAVTGGTCEDPDALASGAGNPSGVVAVDVRDKANPRFVAFAPTRGSHNLVAAVINGTQYIFTNAVDILKFDAETGALEVIADLPGVHDASVAQHPLTGEWLLFTGSDQLSIYNIDNPAEPLPVYLGADDPEKDWIGWHEQTLVPGIVDGRVILVLAGETFASTGEPGSTEGSSVPDALDIVDLTDPTDPKKLATWKPPFDPTLPWASYLYSIHEVAANPTGQVAIAWYHAGVWVIDVSTQDRQAAPVTLAAYQPHNDINVVPATFAQTPLPYVPFVWGAGWSADGYLIVPDMHTGLYVLEPSWGLHPGVDGGQ